MGESDKPKGNLEDADGVTTDEEGNLTLVMEVLRKGGSSDEDMDMFLK